MASKQKKRSADRGAGGDSSAGGIPPGRSSKRLLLRKKRFLNRRADETGLPRDDLWQTGIKHMQRMRIDARVIAAPAPGVPAPAVAGGVRWKQIGPQPLRIDNRQNFQGAGSDSGEVIDIAIDPRGAGDQVIYIATNDGGIWKTTDGGTTWNPKTDFMPSLSMGAVALDAANADIVYAGTGNAFDGGGGGFLDASGVRHGFTKGVGIFRSIDGGETWTHLALAVLGGKQINRIAVPMGDVLLVATNAGLFRSVDGGQNFGANANFDDGNPIVGGDITDLRLDTVTPAATAYACIRGVGILVSTNGGITFDPATNLLKNPNGPAPGSFSRVVFAQSHNESGGRNAGDTFYAAVSDPSVKPPTLLNLYKSTNRGAHWDPMPDALARANESGAGGDQQIEYNLTLGVDPLNDQRVYLGFQQLFVSTDGANSFGSPAASLNHIHYDNHALVFSPHNPGGGATTMPVFVGTDGGIAKSTDGGGTWSQDPHSLNDTLATNLFLGIDLGRGSAANNAVTYGGCQDTGTIEHLATFAGNDWHLGENGDGGPVAVDTGNPQVAYGRTNGLFMFTTNGGGSWTFPLAAATNLPADPGGFSLGTPLAVDLNTAAIVYVTEGNQLFRSTNSGASFTPITFAFPSTIRAFALVKLDSKVALVGCANGKVFRTTNLDVGAAATWTDLTPALSAAGALALPVGGIAIDPTDAALAVVVFDGFSAINPANRTKHVFRTTDAGVTWSDISGTDGAPNPDDNLPDLPVHSVVIDPTGAPHPIIVALDSSVMRTTDDGATWQILGLGVPTVDCTSLAIDAAAAPPVIRVGTYGRSVFELERPNGAAIAVRSNLAFGSVAQGASADLLVQVFNVGTSDLIISDFSDPSGPGDFQLAGAPAFPVTISAGSETDFTVRFSPTKGGNQNTVLSIASNDASHALFAVGASGSSPITGPQISSLQPSTGPASGGTAVRIVGAGFTGATAVTFGSVAASSFTVDSDGQISAVSPPGTGVVNVSVVTASATSAASAASQFTYSGGGIVVSGVNPSQGPQAGGTTVTISGSGFAGATQVQFGAFAASSFTVDSDSQITAISPAGTGTVDVLVANSSGTSAAVAADRFLYTVPGGGTATGTGTTSTGGNTTAGVTGSSGEEQVMSALADILRSGTDPAAIEAQRILLRRIALEGNLVDSRIPAPKDITEIGGYINLLTGLGHTDIRTQMLAGVLGVAGPATPANLTLEGPALAFVSLPNDRPEGPAQATFLTSFTIRSDMADALALALQRVHGFGCLIPFYSPPRVLPAPAPGQLSDPDVLLLLGRVLQIAPAALLQDPANDPIAIARLQGDPPNSWQLVARELDGASRVAPALWSAYQASAANAQVLAPAARQYLPLAAILGDAGWYSSTPLALPDSSVRQGSIPRLTNVTGLIANGTTVGQELSLLYSQPAIMASALNGMLSWIWNGTAFVPPAR